MKRAALFDLDGVILDTETQYSIVWGRIGRQYHPEMPDFSQRIKGMTLVNIFREFFTEGFDDPAATQAAIDKTLFDFEANEMRYDFVAGAREYVLSLRAQGVKTAVVTSSNKQKMSDVRRAIPEFDSMWDTIVTAEMTARSKPAPDCFLKGAEVLGMKPEECIVFEDSQNGMRAGKAAGMLTVGVATTFSREACQAIADAVISDFCDPMTENIHK